MNIENERKLFLEKVAELNWIDKCSLDNCFYIGEDNKFKAKDGDDEFLEHWLNIGFDMWQASVNREGFILVPVEPSYDMIVSAADEHVKNGASYSGIYKAMIKASQENKDE